MPTTAKTMSTETKPHLLILGASGRTGQLVMDEALRRGHTITALVRKSSSLESRSGLTIVEGTPLNHSDISRAISATPTAPTIAISALGQTRKSGNPWSAIKSPPRLMTDSVSNLISVAKSANIKKIVLISMFGAGDSFANLNFLMRWIMKNSNMKQTVEDQNAMDEVVRKGGVEFVMVRPAMLKGQEVAEVKVCEDDGRGMGFMPSISAKSVASFLLDATERNEWDGRSPVIYN